MRVEHSPTRRYRWSWPWLHWCMFDRDCRYWGVPARVHVWPLRLMIEIREEPLPIPWPKPRPSDPRVEGR